MSQPWPARAVADIRARADALAAAWLAEAASVTTAGREQALLRLLGVSGHSRSGHPLAAQITDHYLAGGPGRLGGGIALPFAVAMAEYDLGPAELAQEVAAGNIDLWDEASLLDDPERSGRALAAALELAETTLDRIGANRTARREIRSMLGAAQRPMLGQSLECGASDAAAAEAIAAAEAGADLIRVEAPALDAHHGAVPARSVRGLADLRATLDETGAHLGRYVRLAVDIDALAVDQAVIAGTERVDLALTDPMAEIVAERAAPAHAVADYVFICRILAHAGVDLLVPAGALVAAPDLAAGRAAGPAARSGRSLALQLVATAVARQAGLAPEAILVGAIPDWLADEHDAAARAVAEVEVRRAAFPGHQLALVEPAPGVGAWPAWEALVAALLAGAGDIGLLLRRPSAGGIAQFRAGVHAAEAVRAARTGAGLSGLALQHGEELLAEAARTLEALGTTGWRSIVGDPMDSGAVGPESGAVVRTVEFDPLAVRVG